MAKAIEIWIGAYGSSEEVGVTRLSLDPDAATLTKETEFTGIQNPSFLTMDKSGRYLHAVSEVSTLGGQPGGEVVTFAIEEEGTSLQEVMSHPTLGADPCFVMLDPSERWLAVSNYSGSSVVVYPVEPSGVPGAVSVRFRHSGTGPNASRQEAPHPHSAVFSPDGQFLFIPDLGMDKIMVYALDSDKREWAVHDAVNLAPGAGPRHMKFHPSGKYAYVINELDSTVTRFDYAQPGKLEKQESVTTLPSTFEGESWCAEIVVSPDGRFVYASNRGHDSLAIFSVDADTGELRGAGFVSTRGKYPRNFAITPDGQWLLAANQHSDSVVLFRVDSATGLPVYAGNEIAINKPVCVYIRP
ncbi:lactonase family protein [Cohnella yongneupensis]|uniref:Lactonase family protein n=1 Tax=Cohnella yongneupensis TaxID=425006 RepID=A0ABW0QYN1_9BACL